jgi:hypothetical protein
MKIYFLSYLHLIRLTKCADLLFLASRIFSNIFSSVASSTIIKSYPTTSDKNK